MESSSAAEPPAPKRGTTGLTPLLAASAVSVLFYAVPLGVRHLRMPVGDDAMFYVVSLRSVAHLGLADPQVAVRPGFPLLGSLLGAVTGSTPWAVAVSAPMAFAAAAGLSGSALAARWRLRGWGLAAFALLAATSGVIARLVAGKAENLMALWLMAAVLAVGLWGGRDRSGSGEPAASRRPAALRWLAPAALSATATLVEWPLAAAFVGILGVAWATAWVTSRLGDAARRSSVAEPEPLLRGLLLASAVGLGAGLLAAFLGSGAGPGSGIQNLPPGYRYGARLRDELSLVRPWITGPLTLAGLCVAWGRERRPQALSVVLGVWLAGTVLVLAGGWVGVQGPTYRVLLLALPVVLAAAAAPFLPLVGIRPFAGNRRRAAAIVAVALAAAALLPGALMWWRGALGTPTSVEQLAEVSAAARYAESLPGSNPVVLVLGRAELPFAESLLYSRMAASVLPADDADRVLIFVGRAQDALAGRPTTGRGPGEDAVVRRLFGNVSRALAAGAPVLSGRSLDPDGYRAATALGTPLIGGRAVALVRGPDPGAGQEGSVAVVAVPGWFGVMSEALVTLALLAAAGLGWSRLSLPAAPAEIRWLLAPAFGAAALTVVAYGLVRAHVRPAGGGAWAALVVALAAGEAVRWVARRRGAVLSRR